MRIRQVDPKHIKVPSLRVTSVWDEESLQEFVDSVKADGILEPIVVQEVNGDLYLVDGLHRMLAAQKLGLKRVPVVVRDGEEVDVYLRNLVLNNLRGKVRPTEAAAVFRHLYEERGLGVDEISRKTGFSEERVSKLLHLSRATPEVLQALDQGLIGLGHAYALARIEDPGVQGRILSTQLRFRFTVPVLEQHIEDVRREKERLESAPPPVVHVALKALACATCGRVFPLSQLASPTICVGCYGYLLDSLRQAQALRQAEAVAEAAGRAGEDGDGGGHETM